MHRYALVGLVLAVVVAFASWVVFFLGRHEAPLPEPPAAKAAGSTVSPSRVLAVVNVVRKRHGRRPLERSRKLSQAATKHSREMGRFGYFAHRSADGRVFWRRILRYYGRSGFRLWTVGENLAWGETSTTARRLVRRWMQSPEHRITLLARRWREIGVGSVTRIEAQGFYGSRDVVIVTADFGRRRR